MTNLVLHAVLHDPKTYHLFRFKILMKMITEMKNSGAEYFKINIECIEYFIYNIHGRSHTQGVSTRGVRSTCVPENHDISDPLGWFLPVCMLT